MGNTAPSLGTTIFRDTENRNKNVTVRVPAGAEGNYNATWQNNFKGQYSGVNVTIVTY
jgi:hypothetical protein